MNRPFRAVIALPLVVVAVALCGLAVGGHGVLAEPLLSRTGGGGLIQWIAVGIGAVVLGAAADYFFSRLSRKQFGLSEASLLAVRDAILIIAGAALAIGGTFLLLSLFPAHASQVWPLRATGAMLIAGGALLFFLRLRMSAKRRSSPP